MKVNLTIAAALAASIVIGFLQSTAHGNSPRRDLEGKELNVVILGDSFSAGNGADGWEYGPGGCYRNTKAWSSLYKKSLESRGLTVTMFNRACSGAKTEHFKHPQTVTKFYARAETKGSVATQEHIRYLVANKNICKQKENPDLIVDYSVMGVQAAPEGDRHTIQVECRYRVQPQIDSVDTSTDLVAMTIGGNDLEFGAIVKQCFAKGLRLFGDCKKALSSARDMSSSLLEQNTRGILDALRARMRPDAKIVLMGYPLLAFDNDVRHFNFPVAQEVRKAGLEFNRKQKEFVARYNEAAGSRQVTFIDTIPGYFAGHEPDAAADYRNPDRWIHEFFEPSLDSNLWYHPNHMGHAHYAMALRDTLKIEEVARPIKPHNEDVDVAFVIDTTGSMGYTIEAMKQKMLRFADVVNKRSRHARFAVITYQDHPEAGGGLEDYPARVDLDFTSQAHEVKKAIEALHVGAAVTYKSRCTLA